MAPNCLFVLEKSNIAVYHVEKTAFAQKFNALMLGEPKTVFLFLCAFKNNPGGISRRNPPCTPQEASRPDFFTIKMFHYEQF
jgi:hypothetical protein